jgi:hypothetical protein
MAWVESGKVVPIFPRGNYPSILLVLLVRISKFGNVLLLMFWNNTETASVRAIHTVYAFFTAIDDSHSTAS